jgi:hypothetical protein
MNKNRLECERLIYKIMSILDPSEKNTQFWIEEFSKMSDEQFKKYITGHYPLYFQTGAFKEPSIEQITKALKEINVPLLESVYMPYKYKDPKTGKPVKSKPCLVVYYHEKRMKQILTKKNSSSIYADTRDMRTGLLTGIDKNGKESDREFESLAVSGLTNMTKELSRPRADAMNDKNIMNNTIKNLGQVSLKDLPDDIDDSLSKNMLNAYFIGAQLYSNIVEKDSYMLQYTDKDKDKKIQRID